ADDARERFARDRDLRRRVPEVPADLDAIALAGRAVGGAADGILRLGRSGACQQRKTDDGDRYACAHVKALGPGMNKYGNTPWEGGGSLLGKAGPRIAHILDGDGPLASAVTAVRPPVSARVLPRS